MADAMNSRTPERHVAVVGVGYVGLTLLCALGKAGYQALGYDINARRVDAINNGQLPFEGAEEEMRCLLADLASRGRIRATADPHELHAAETVFIAVETPVDDIDHRPRYLALRAALQAIAPHLRQGVLVAVESTIAPGTMRGLVLPALRAAHEWEVGTDFFLLHCPERVMPGRLLRNISTCDRVVGGMTPACTARGMAIYADITSGTLHPSDALTAEIVKTTENAYRDVQIAFANELALLCEELGADVYAVRELVNSSPQRHMHLPGAGVGGHCIPKDPWLLCSSVSVYQPRLLPIAREINDGMPFHLLALLLRALSADGREITESVITLLGAAYLEGTDDVRNTPTLPLARRLVDLGATVRIVDPFVTQLEEFAVETDLRTSTGSDALVLLTAHTAFQQLDLVTCAMEMRTRILIDGRNAFSEHRALQAGFRYLGIGKGRLPIEIPSTL